VPVRILARTDPEVAAATFKNHLDRLWGTGRPSRLGWIRNDVDALHTLVTLPAKRPTGEIDPYYFRLGAEYYDVAPPTVALVQPDGVTHAPQISKWFPVLGSKPDWFGLHAQYPWPSGPPRQLVCFTLSAEYYMTDHSPKESEEWKQGQHTVAATLYRLAEILSPKYYRNPAA
jgi:hypothetical protein